MSGHCFFFVITAVGWVSVLVVCLDFPPISCTCCFVAQATHSRQCWMCGTMHVFVSFGGTCPAFGCVLIAEDTSRGDASTPPLPGGGVANIRLLNLDYKNCKIATQLRYLFELLFTFYILSYISHSTHLIL